MLKRIWFNIYSLWFYLFKGLIQADKVAFGNKDESLGSDSSYEEQNEQNSVWQDLLKGELTQRVIDLRYETAHSCRESKKYEYVGGGKSNKKSMFSYNGNIENEENLPIFLVQSNGEDVSTIVDYNTKAIRTFRFNISYDYLCRYRLDAYTKKVVIRKDKDVVIVDFYTSKYHEKSNNEHKFFLAEVNRILKGDRRSDILGIKTLTFDTFNAYGADDGITYTFDKFKYIDALEFDGNIVLRFSAKLKSTNDFIDEIYDKKSEEKFLNKTKRENSKQSFTTVKESIKETDENEAFADKLKEALEGNGSKN